MKVPGVDTLRDALAALSLDTRGHKAQLKKRLRTASKKAAPVAKEGADAPIHGKAVELAQRPSDQDFDSYLVLDFEATCQRHEPVHGHFFGFPNEVRYLCNSESQLHDAK